MLEVLSYHLSHGIVKSLCNTAEHETVEKQIGMEECNHIE